MRLARFVQALATGALLAMTAPTVPADNAFVELSHIRWLDAGGDTIQNVVYPQESGWLMWLDFHGQGTLTGPAVQFASGRAFQGFDPYPTSIPAPGTYVWSHPGTVLHTGENFHAEADEAGDLAGPGYTAARTVTNPLLTADSATQTVRMSFRLDAPPDPNLNHVSVRIGSFNDDQGLVAEQVVSQSPVAGWTTGSDGWWWADPAGLSVGTEYLFEAQVHVTKQPGYSGQTIYHKPQCYISTADRTSYPDQVASSVVIPHPEGETAVFSANATVTWQPVAARDRLDAFIRPVSVPVGGGLSVGSVKMHYGRVPVGAPGQWAYEFFLDVDAANMAGGRIVTPTGRTWELLFDEGQWCLDFSDMGLSQADLGSLGIVPGDYAVTFDAADGNSLTTTVPFLPVLPAQMPNITAPPPEATVGEEGFTLEWDPVSDANVNVIHVEAEDVSTDAWDTQADLEPDQNSLPLTDLPPGARIETFVAFAHASTGMTGEAVPWLVAGFTVTRRGFHVASVQETRWNVASGQWYQVGNWTSGLPQAGIDAIIENGGTAEAWGGSIDANEVRVGVAGAGRLELRGADLTAVKLSVGSEGELETGGATIRAAVRNFGSAEIINTGIEGQVFNAGYMELGEVNVTGSVTNVGELDIEDATDINGSLHNTLAGMVLIADELDLDANVHNEGLLRLFPGSDISCEVDLRNDGRLELWSATAGTNGTVHNAGDVEGAGVLAGLEGVVNTGQVTASAGNLALYSEGPVTNAGTLEARPACSLMVLAASLVHTGRIVAQSNGAVNISGPLTNPPGASIELLGGTVSAERITHQAGAALTGFGGLVAAALVNQGTIDLFGDTHIVGDVTNQPGALLGIRNGDLLVTGRTRNDGTVKVLNGQAFFEGGYSGNGILDIDPARAVMVGDVEIGPAGVLTVDANSTLQLLGDLAIASTRKDAFDISGGTVEFHGQGEQLLEAAGADLGADPAGWTENFAIGRLVLRAGTTVRLADQFDNSPGPPEPEAVYVDELLIEPGAWILLDGLNLYYLHAGDPNSRSPRRLFYGDFTLDGTVGAADYLVWKANVSTPAGAGWREGDTDGDGDVDRDDLLVLTGNFGAVAADPGAASLPEPGTAALLALPALALLMRRRR